MRACMLAYTFYETDTRVRRYAEALVERGDQVDAIALRRDGQKRDEIVAGVHVYRLQKRKHDESGPFSYLAKLLLFFVRSAWVVTRNHLRARYDVIHVHSVPDFEVFATVVPRLMGARIFLDIHDIVPELYASKFKISHSSVVFKLLVILERLSVRYSHHVIIANHLWHERLVQRSARPERCSTILNYPDLSVFYRRPRKITNKNEFVMFYPGTLSWHQGIDLVISAMAHLGNKAPNLRFIIFGDGHERDRLLAMAKELGLEDRVTIMQERPASEVAEAMAKADLGVEPKRKHSFANEALSTKILEFMAMDVPVLASDTRVHEMYFKDGTVQYFESENIADLAAKILELMHDPDKCDALRARGRSLVQDYGWKEKKGEYLSLVDRVVNGCALCS